MKKPALSARLMELAGDELPAPSDPEFYLNVIKFAQLAWNYSVLPKGCRQSDAIELNIARMPPLERLAFLDRLEQWVARKRSMFPDDQRLALQVVLKGIGKRMSLEVSSAEIDDPRIKAVIHQGAS